MSGDSSKTVPFRLMLKCIPLKYAKAILTFVSDSRSFVIWEYS